MNIQTIQTVRNLAKTPKQRGATLIEVLVTMMIVAIGLLGAAGMQLASTRYQQTAYMRTQATVQAQFIVEKIKVNNSAVIAAAPPTPANAYLAPVGYAAANALPADPACGLAGQPVCTAAQAAQRDMRDWGLSLARDLPGGRGAIWPVTNGAITDPAARQVVVMWQEKQNNETTELNVAQTDASCPGPVAALVVGVRCWTVVVTP
jgi:type IV pilus assembly protein PilV